MALICASSLVAQNLRTVPEGTRLKNDLITPIYIEVVDPPGKGTITRIRLKDASGYRVDVFAERTKIVNIDRQVVRTVQLYLFHAPGKEGSVPIEVNSDKEESYLTALSAGLEHYAPGWTQNWSEEGHEALRALIRDISNRRNASVRRSTPLERAIGRD